MLNEYQEYCEKFKAEAQLKKSPPDRNDWLYVNNYSEDEAIKLRLGYDLYYFTKAFLEKNKDKLTPREKGDVFTKYVSLWQHCNCRLTLEMAGVADEYEEAKFGKRAEEYSEFSPMTVGFNLAGADINPTRYFLLQRASFLSVNLRDAKLVKNVNESAISELDFKDCDMAGFVLTGYFEDVAFHSCNLEGADFSGSELPRGKFVECNLRAANVGQKNSSHFLSFARNCVTSNQTSVFRGWNSADTPQVSIVTHTQNFDNQSVIAVWKEQLEKGNSIPIAFRRVLTNDYEYMKQVQNCGKSFEELLRAKNAGKKLQRILRHEECNPKHVVEAVKEGASLDLRTDTIWSCASYLVMAVGKGNVDVAVEILRNSKNPKKLLSIGHPVHNAVELNDTKMLEAMFREAGQYIDVNRTNASGKTALQIAIEKQFEDGVRILLEKGADPALSNGEGLKPLEKAVRCSNTQIVRLLLDAHKKKSGTIDPAFCHLLFDKAMSADKGPFVETIKMLFAEGLQLDRTKDAHFLKMAVENGNPDLVALLLAQGLSPKSCDQWKATPLHRVGRVQNEADAIKIAQMLIAAGADLSARNDDDETPCEHIRGIKPAYAGLIKLLSQTPSPVVAASSIEIQGKVVENIIGK